MSVSIEQARTFLEGKEASRRHKLDALFARATDDFGKILELIVGKYRPLRVYQWGSLLDRSKFREYSDIDIAVEGVDTPEEFFCMFGEAEKLTSFSLDLLDINKIAPEFADIIRMKGRVVYERKD